MFCMWDCKNWSLYKMFFDKIGMYFKRGFYMGLVVVLFSYMFKKCVVVECYIMYFIVSEFV